MSTSTPNLPMSTTPAVAPKPKLDRPNTAFREPYTPVMDRRESASEVFQRAINCNARHNLSSAMSDPRTARLTRMPYPDCLFRNEPCSNVALALPILPSQLSCHGKHSVWHISLSTSMSSPVPVECNVCLCAGDCGTAAEDFWTCGFCSLRVCSECRLVFETRGREGLMRRIIDGSESEELGPFRRHHQHGKTRAKG